MTYPPIAIFAYNRPQHLEQTLLALAQNPEANETDIIIFCDGAKASTDLDRIQKTREVARAARGFKSVQIVERDKNLGLANSIISGVTDLVNKHDAIIVLEDDLVVSKYFLKYMHDGIALYKDNPRVCSIHGYTLPVKGQLPETYFLKGGDCWGWATWRSAWQHFNPNGQELLDQIKQKKLEYEFDLNGAYAYTKMLEDQIAGKNNSWAIRWRAATFLKDMYTLNPGRSLVHNIGFDGSGEHCGVNDTYSTALSTSPVQVESVDIRESQKVLKSIEQYYWGIKTSPGKLKVYFEKLKQILIHRQAVK